MNEVGGDTAPIADGYMACDIVGSWATYAAGVGVSGPVDEAVIEELIAFYRDRGRLPQIAVTPYQHTSLMEGLARRGFTPYEFINVLYASPDLVIEGSEHPVGLEFEKLDPSREDQVERFVKAHLKGFYGEDIPEGIHPITYRIATHPRCDFWFFVLDGQDVGVGGLEHFENTGVLIGACVNQEYRGRGIHSEFLRFRHEEAGRRGYDYVTVGSVPGTGTERNAQRLGFHVAYTEVGMRLNDAG